jgi:tripartite-type tricarboxylate transporter receptor subunit TctC
MRWDANLYLAAVACGWFGLTPATATADPIEDFYKDKRLSVVVGSAPGGGFDAYARLVSDNIGRFLPGRPSSLVQNIPGASSLKSVGYVYNSAPQDGTVIGIPNGAVPFNAFVKGETGEGVDVTKLQWLGRLASTDYVAIVWHETGVKSFDDLKNRKTFFAGSSGEGGAVLLPLALNKLFGAKIELALGYGSNGERFAALERREVDGMITFWSEVEHSRPQWISERKIIPLLQDGSERRARIPKDVPAVVEFAKTDNERDVLQLLSTPGEFGRTFYVGPKVPPDKVAALRKAFGDMTADAGFKATMEKLKLDLDPLSGEKLQARINEMSHYRKEVFEQTKALSPAEKTP